MGWSYERNAWNLTEKRAALWLPSNHYYKHEIYSSQNFLIIDLIYHFDNFSFVIHTHHPSLWHLSIKTDYMLRFNSVLSFVHYHGQLLVSRVNSLYGVTSSARESRHKVSTVGCIRPFSMLLICDLLTPDNSSKARIDKPRSIRNSCKW